MHGVDNKNNMWVWGNDIYAQHDETDRGVLYENWDQREHGSHPMRVKWFSDNTLKVLDVKGGYERAVVKCEDKDGKIVFYAMATAEEGLKHLGGSASLTSAYKHYISRMEVDGSRVEDFDIGRSAVYLLMAADKQEIQSIDPDHPEEKGLIHFYQQANEAGETEWKFLTKAQYDEQKDSLPDVCFATRHPIKGLLDRVTR